MLYWVHLVWVGFELTTLVVIGTDCIGSIKSNYHTITATTNSIYIQGQNVKTISSSLFSNLKINIEPKPYRMFVYTYSVYMLEMTNAWQKLHY
jgi:hypothetical protein